MVKCGRCKYYQIDATDSPWRGECIITLPAPLQQQDLNRFTRADNGCDLGVDVISEATL